MNDGPLRFFKLADWVGRDETTGVQGPLVQDVMRFGTEVRDPLTGAWKADQRIVTLLPVTPGSRITATRDPAVAAVLEDSHKYVEVDMPRALRRRKPRYR